MSSGPRSDLLHQFRTLFESGTVAGLTDGQLLERFLTGRDEAGEVAFAALVARHGPMVLGVCRRALADPNDADDAFQATFLVLVKKARSVRVDDSLGRWLYGVSLRVASRARSVAGRRPLAEAGVLDSIEAASPDPDRFELQAMLDEELARLPEAFRSAIVLCDLEGLTHEEAARDLLCPVGTIKSRLARGRKRLRERLERRGVSPSTLMLAPVVPPALARAAVRASTMSMGSGAPAAGLVPAAAASLAREVVKTMTGIKLKLAAAAALSLGLMASGVGVFAQGKGGEAGPTAGAPAEAEGPADRLPLADERADRHVVEVLGDRITLDGEAVKPEGLAKALKSLMDAGADNAPGVLVRVSDDQKYKDVRRVIDAIEGVGFRRIDIEPAADAGRPTRPEVGPKAQPPGEFRKVSMPEYVVEPPDLIRVEVFDALEGRPITGERLVRPDGKISLGFYGEVYVAGLTTTEVKEKIALHLRKYLDDEKLGLSRTHPGTDRLVRIDPALTDRISAEVVGYNSKFFYVQGEVGSPGRFNITGEETVLDAINHAGGLTPTASKANIHLVRPAPPGASGEQVLPVDYAAIVDRGEAKTNYQMFPKDRLVVYRDPKSGPKDDGATKREADLEARLQAVERKLDEMIKALERLPKP